MNYDFIAPYFNRIVVFCFMKNSLDCFLQRFILFNSLDWSILEFWKHDVIDHVDDSIASFNIWHSNAR